MKEIKHYWHSEKQRKVSDEINGMSGYRSFAMIDGKEMEYTESMSEYRKSNFDDAVYLGAGTYYKSTLVF